MMLYAQNKGGFLEQKNLKHIREMQQEIACINTERLHLLYRECCSSRFIVNIHGVIEIHRQQQVISNSIFETLLKNPQSFCF